MALALEAVPQLQGDRLPAWKSRVRATLLEAKNRPPAAWEMEHAVALLVEWLYACGWKDLTVQSHYFCLARFVRWCRSTTGGAGLAVPNRSLLQRFFAHLKEQRLAGYTVKNYAASLGVFFEFLCDRGYRPDNPMASLRVRPAIEPTPVTALREDELRTLLEAADRRYRETPPHHRNTRLRALRDKVLLEVLVATGLRASEIAGLRVGDVDLERRCLHVRGKGGGGYVKRNRIAFIDHPVLLADLERYLAERGAPPEAPLFPTQLHSGHFQPPMVGRILQGLAKRAGLTRRIYSHLFRHTFCCYLIGHGADAFSVQKLMGHHRIEITLQYYLHLTPDETRADWQAHHPLCREVRPC